MAMPLCSFIDHSTRPTHTKMKQERSQQEISIHQTSPFVFEREAQNNLIQMEEQMGKILSYYSNLIVSVANAVNTFLGFSSADYLMEETDDHLFILD
jgi:hypothetical protein